MNFVLSDPELITAVRNGDISAYAGLYSRHAHAANRLARVLTHDRDDVQRLVSDSFASVRLAVASGGGPAVIFRTYLLTTLRDVHHDQLRRRRGLRGDSEQSGKEPLDGLVDSADLPPSTGSLIAEAVSRLPARWQLVLWHIEVEGESPLVVGPILGLAGAEVLTLAERARERLRSTYLQEMERQPLTAECSWATQRLAAGVWQQSIDPDQERLDNHVATCEHCHQRFPEFYRLEHRMAEVLGPLVLGGLAETYASGGSLPISSMTDGFAVIPRRSWGRRLPWIGVVSAAVAGAGAIVILSALYLGSPAQVTGLAAPKEVADTGHTPSSSAPSADVTVILRGTLVRARSTQLEIQVANAGPASSGMVTLVLTLPAGTSVSGALPGRWQCSGRTTTLVCTHPALAAQESTAGAVTVTVEPTARLGSRVKAEISPAQADRASDNNRAESAVG